MRGENSPCGGKIPTGALGWVGGGAIRPGNSQDRIPGWNPVVPADPQEPQVETKKTDQVGIKYNLNIICEIPYTVF